MSKIYLESVRNAALLVTVESRLLSDLLFAPQRDSPSDCGNSIAIVGGELFNKGGQAMTFTVVHQVTKRYPQKDIYLLSRRDYERDPNDKAQYEFEILPWGPEIRLSLLSPGLDVVNTNQYSKEDRTKVRRVLRDCSKLIDINGLALSSQMSTAGSFGYLVDIMIAKEYDVPMYIFPQSIGPFNYPTTSSLLLNPLMQTYLGYPEIISPRERAGVEALAPYTRSNVHQEFDIVLQDEGYDLGNIYASEPNLKRKELDTDAVGIVPNSKVFERAEPEDIYSLYETAIDLLLKERNNIYVFRHSVEDLELCRKIKSRYSDTDNVRLFEEDLDAPELEHIIGQCDFLIASRYHSIVHAYKNAVPVIAIGWAVKYEELLEAFDQCEYFFEGREKIDTDSFVRAVKQMNEQWMEESEIIQAKLQEVQRDNLFDRFFSDPS